MRVFEVFALPNSALLWFANRHAGWTLPYVCSSLVMMVLMWRAFTIRVDEDGEGLAVRNLLTTRRVRWDEVTSFGERRAFLVSQKWRDTVVPVLVTRSRTIPLLAMPLSAAREAAVVERWARRAT